MNSESWKDILASAAKTRADLLSRAGIKDDEALPIIQGEKQFPVLVPQPFIDKMEMGNPDDPLLLQVLSQASEDIQQEGFIADPLAEKNSNHQRGIIHKYHSRALVLLTGGCAVNCRYCFRRHFPYQENRLGKQHWQEVLEYLNKNTSLSEVILSGGDPLLLDDHLLENYINQLEAIPHITKLRIHTRLPVVIPQRITEKFVKLLNDSRFACSIVFHINHPNEIDSLFEKQIEPLQRSKTVLLNQSVLLKGINDSSEILCNLSEKLFTAGIIPYYLHLLDKVSGAAHFDMSKEAALIIYKEMHLKLSGYLVPKLTREEPGKGCKTPINLSL